MLATSVNVQRSTLRQSATKPGPPVILDMHHCLTIQEILRVILGFYDLSPHSPECRTARSTLLAAALTCRAFVDPALDRLWCNLFSLRPLFMCLPEDSCEDRALEESQLIHDLWQVGDMTLVSGSMFCLSFDIDT